MSITDKVLFMANLHVKSVCIQLRNKYIYDFFRVPCLYMGCIQNFQQKAVLSAVQVINFPIFIGSPAVHGPETFRKSCNKSVEVIK
jgi:hypothetical protein